ncbi:MAG TPA: histidine kinase dimerization/phosphoacceptor domain -containing protein [Flavipsychrobacter sp.]
MFRFLMILRSGLIILIALLIVIPRAVHAQTSKIYIAKLKSCTTAEDSADNYAWAAMCAAAEYEKENGMVYARKAEQLAKKLKDPTRMAAVYFALSNLYLGIDESDSARIYGLKSVEQYDLAGTKGTYYTYALNNIAAYYLNTGDAKTALKYAHMQLEAASELKDTLSTSNSYTMLTAIYELLGNLDESIRYAEKALDLNERIGNVFNRAIVLSNLGLLYNSAGRYEEALRYVHQSIYYATEMDNTPRQQTIGYMLAGESHSHLKNYDSALYYLARAQNMIEHIDAPQDRVKLLNIYAATFKALGRYREGVQSLQKAIVIAREKKLAKMHSLSAKALAELSELEQDYPTAYNALKEHKAIEDSLSGAEVQKTIAELKEKYESEKKDERIAQQKQNNQWLIGGLLIAALLAGLILIQYLRQRTANATIQKQSDKLTLLMKELHHRVKNNLQIISSLLSLQSFRIKDEKASRAVREGQQRIEAMSLIHQRLYTRDNITEINIREYISDLVDSLQSAYGFSKDRINIRMDIADELMNVDQAIPLSLIVNELVTNAFKYAYEDNNAPELTITLERKNGNIVLQVADNGKGVNIEEWKDKDGSFGKELIQTFVEQLNGYLDIVVDKGSQFTLSIPYTA